MARSISRLVLVAACVAGLAGCGSGVGTSMGQAYALCYNADPTATTADIDAIVRIIRFARQDGFSAGYVFATLGPACEGEPNTCEQCLTALIDAVY